ncbi:hypothetical protein ACFWUQ_24235 [Streptomyces sp. NPDC058662]|uniref:hypothetical protein n=1 Tax=Streptomyces sp. NPDC058662 TaxID=3346583 RepID=UPI003652774B
MDKFYAAVAGAFVMLFLTPMMHPLAKRLEAISRRIYKIKAVAIHIERDPSIIWSGYPNWVGASVWMPELPADAPDHPTDWYNWARPLGGSDARLTVLKVSITSRDTAAILVEPPKIRSLPLPIGDPPKGIVATYPVGGAELNPRRVQVDLEWGAATWVGPEGAPIRALNLSLAPGETEQFHIYAHAAAGRYQWRLELPLLVDGKRLTVRVEDDGEPFITYGSSGFSEYLWHDDQWVARENT